MARIRTIKPEFWSDEKIVQLPYEARLLFVGLWNFADDEGYLYDAPERIKLQVFPGDDVCAEHLLGMLLASGLIERHATESGHFALFVPQFARHQVISHRTPSRIAPEISGKLRIPDGVRRKVAEKYGCPPGGQAEVQCYYCGMPGMIYWPKLSSGRPGFWVCFSGLEMDHFVAESRGGETTCDNLVLACRECNRSKHDLDGFSKILAKLQECSGSPTGAFWPEGKGREGKGKENVLAHPAAPSERTRQVPEGRYSKEFKTWWAIYPRKVAKGDGFKAWKKAIARLKREQSELLLNEVTEAFAKSPAGQAGEFCPYPATWLNREQYNDDPAEWQRRHSEGKQSAPDASAFLEK